VAARVVMVMAVAALAPALAQGSEQAPEKGTVAAAPEQVVAAAPMQRLALPSRSCLRW